jgi:hypothetical protein
VQTVLQFLPPDGRPRVFSLHNDPGTVPLDPTRLQASGRFGGEGFFHILQGPDHLLFLFVLVIPFLPARFGAAVRWKALGPLAAIVTSFTVAHSVAFIASAYDLTPGALWFPAFVDAMVAASILYVALENLVRPNFRRRWMVAFGFGLAHGFAFAIALRDSWQFTGDHFLLSLLSFNGGLEIGQLVALIAIVPVLMILFRFVVDEPIGIVILSLLVAHTGWHWTVDRYAAYRRFQFVWPVVDAAFFVIVIRWLMIAVVLAGLAWLIFGVFGQRGHEDTKARNQS